MDDAIRRAEEHLRDLRAKRTRDRKRAAQNDTEMLRRKAAKFSATWAAKSPDERAAHAAAVSAGMRALGRSVRQGTTTAAAARKRMAAAQRKRFAKLSAKQRAAQVAAALEARRAAKFAAAFSKAEKAKPKPKAPAGPREFRHLTKRGTAADVPRIQSFADLLMLGGE